MSLVENAMIALHAHELGDRGDRIAPGKRISTPSVVDGPATLGDERTRLDARGEVAGGRQDVHVFAEARIGAISDDQRQTHVFVVVHRVDRHPVLRDDLDLAVLLPQGERLALDDADRQVAGIELADFRVLISGTFSRRWRMPTASR